ncbi:hypothetical protein BDR06DRAFT_957700 [Suillus hirtellus]|nr:hypothetical protein BDR06DRAFT_957700 [Suillus hirtellus]
MYVMLLCDFDGRNVKLSLLVFVEEQRAGNAVSPVVSLNCASITINIDLSLELLVNLTRAVLGMAQDHKLSIL